jgi:hypothetical protein
MNSTLPLKEMTVAQKIGVMEEIWADLSSDPQTYSTPDWHGHVLEDRLQLAESGAVGFTDWEVAKKQIKDRTS